MSLQMTQFCSFLCLSNVPVPDELWNEVRDIVQETGIKTIPVEKKCKKAKWLSGEALQIAVKRREAKSNRSGVQGGEYVHTRDSFMLMYGKANTVL